MQYPTQLLYNLRETTAWISGNDLGNLVYSLGDGNYFIYAELEKLDKEAARLLQSSQFSVVESNVSWDVIENNLTFIEAFKLRETIGRNKSFIVPLTAAIIIHNQVFYEKDIEFSDGFMSIKDVNFLMCRWVD